MHILSIYVIKKSTGIKLSMNCIPWYLAFPVQHSYLDTSTSKADYIITFLGLWEQWFAGKAIHTSWPSFSFVSKMSENTQCSPQSRDILRLKHLIIETNREISELLEECESRILTKQ